MPERGTESILVVDDETAVLSLTRLMLTRYGYSVIEAGGGNETLHLFEVWPDLQVDLALIDIVMPDMNGLELTERLVAIRPDLPVLYISAYSENEALRPVVTRGLPYLSKPFTSVKLIARIREILDARAKRSGTAD